MRTIAAGMLILSLAAVPAQAQQWAGILAPSRAVDWSRAGVTGGIPNRSTICQTLNPGATASQINTAIQNCPNGQVVFLNAGTYSLTGGLTFLGKSVTLRGAGANATFLNFSGENSCGGHSATICMSAPVPMDPDQPQNSATWSAGYARGTTTVTLSNKVNLQIGSLLMLGQRWETIAEDNGNVFQCHGSGCTQSGGNAPGGANREQNQLVIVTSISTGSCPCTVGISPGIYMPNFAANRSPNAVWQSGLPLNGAGVENLSVNNSSSGAQNVFNINYAVNSWVKNVRSIKPSSHHVRFFVSAKNTVRDSYFHDGQTHQSESYGINPFISADNLIENNIFSYITSPMQNESGTGNVFAYNFSLNDLFYDGTWAQASINFHSGNNNYLLFESNDGYGNNFDNYHGVAHFVTIFRNRNTGFEGVNQSQTVPFYSYSYSRYNHAIGNVLGWNAYHTTYQTIYGVNGENTTACYHSIYAVGWGAHCDIGGGNPRSDLRAGETLLRWGNYDTVNDAARFVASEVPSGDAYYPNAVPTTQIIPASFYLPSKPSFYGSQSWPSIGPDVTGGSEPNVGGHNDKIPARRCWENVMGGTFANSTVLKTYDASLCYASGGGGGGDVTPPTSPQNLRVLP